MMDAKKGFWMFLILLQSSLMAQSAQTEEYEPLFSDVVLSAATESGIPPSILLGLFWTESKFAERATRSELHLCRRHGWEGSLCTSYGLGQIIFGYHARLCGLSSPKELERMPIAVTCTAKVLRYFVEIENGNIKKGLRRFNGLGRKGKNYPALVLANARMFR